MKNGVYILRLPGTQRWEVYTKYNNIIRKHSDYTMEERWSQALKIANKICAEDNIPLHTETIENADLISEKLKHIIKEFN